MYVGEQEGKWPKIWSEHKLFRFESPFSRQPNTRCWIPVGELLSLEGSSIGEVIYSAHDEQTWLLDLGATFHVTHHREWFSNYSAGAGSVRLGNGQECPITRTCEIPIWLPNGNVITLHQVRQVPNLKRSLISIGMLSKDGYKGTLSELSRQIRKGNLHIGHGVRYNNVYPLTLINKEGSLNVVDSVICHKLGLNDFH